MNFIMKTTIIVEMIFNNRKLDCKNTNNHRLSKSQNKKSVKGLSLNS